MTGAAEAGARTLMIQGTASGVGKSLLTAGICRVLAQDGLRVAPFKAWNMALNSAVTADGGEIGRSQALQAEAAGIAPEVHHNPVLLKPQAGGRCQVVIQGRVAAAGDPAAQWRAIRASLAHLRARHDVVLIEGAGSPAELNLRGRDIANMRTARLAGAPVLLVADIARGGVFASLLGTLALLSPAERRRVAGLVVNNFHGDPAHFADGVEILQRRAQRAVLGVLPHLQDLALDEEDGVALWEARPTAAGPLRVTVVRLPHIANFTDTDVLRHEPDVQLRYSADPADLAAADLIVLPGSKDTLADLDWLHDRGLATELRRLAAAGTRLLGLCGGYQMLGMRVRDPLGVESTRGERPGLGLLPVETVLRAEKATRQVLGRVVAPEPLRGLGLSGYEVHMGETARAPGCAPFAELQSHSGGFADGAAAPDGRVFGTYIHGLLDDDALRRGLLNLLRAERGLPPLPAEVRAAARRAAALNRLAATLRVHLDLTRVRALLDPPGGEGP